MTEPTTHILESTEASISSGTIDPRRPPALTIESGDVVECRMLRTWPIEWGWNSFPLGVGALPSDFDEPYVHYFRFNEDRTSAEFVDGIRIPLRPSMGVYAVEPEGDEPISAILAGPHGGNLDLWELTEGTSLFLPVFKSGARIWTGDANATQSDGVVDQTGIESAMEELRVQSSSTRV